MCHELEEELKVLVTKEKRAQQYQAVHSSSTSSDQAEVNVRSPSSVSSDLTSTETSEDKKGGGDIRAYTKQFLEFTREEARSLKGD